MHLVLIGLLFNGADLLSGIAGAVKEKNLKSGKLRAGLFKKCGFILCYALAILIDSFGWEIGINLNFKLLPAIVSYVVITETSSIFENTCVINPDLKGTKIAQLFHITKEGE